MKRIKSKDLPIPSSVWQSVAKMAHLAAIYENGYEGFKQVDSEKQVAQATAAFLWQVKRIADFQMEWGESSKRNLPATNTDLFRLALIVSVLEDAYRAIVDLKLEREDFDLWIERDIGNFISETARGSLYLTQEQIANAVGAGGNWGGPRDAAFEMAGSVFGVSGQTAKTWLLQDGEGAGRRIADIQSIGGVGASELFSKAKDRIGAELDNLVPRTRSRRGLVLETTKGDRSDH